MVSPAFVLALFILVSLVLGMSAVASAQTHQTRGKSDVDAHFQTTLRHLEDLLQRAKGTGDFSFRAVPPGPGYSELDLRTVALFNDLMTVIREKSQLFEETRTQVEAASRLASIGEFAAGLAHEINNPLDGIMSCLARLEKEPENLAQNFEYLRMMREALDRLHEATKKLLEHSRKQEQHLEFLDVHLVIENVVGLMRMAARQKAIVIEFDLDNSVPLVWGDRHALTQVFLNIALNAVAAIAEAGEQKPPPGGGTYPHSGTIQFKTRAVVDGESEHEYVEVAISDDGIGISHDVVDMIFEPFFTTKDPGKGTGMGLTIVKAIVEENQGVVAVDSALDEGTTVSVRLPADPVGETPYKEGVAT